MREQGDMHSEYETASTELKTLVMSSLNKLFNKRDLKNMELEYKGLKTKINWSSQIYK